MYARQHKKTGLQSAFEGPFRIHERLSRSTFKIEVGRYHSGELRFEIRHANDLKLAHPKSMAAEAQRPKLGRPSSATVASPSSTELPQPEARPELIPSSNNSPPSDPPVEPVQLPSSSRPSNNNKQTPSNDSNVGGNRPVRSTRNKNPIYVDSLDILVTGPPPFRGFAGIRGPA